MSRTIYFFGGEDSDFTASGTTSVDTTSSHRRTSYCRCALQMADGNSTIDTGNIGSLTDVWIHARVWMTALASMNGSTSGTNPEKALLRITDASGIVRLMLYITTVQGSNNNTSPSLWRVATVNAAGTVTTLGAVFSNTFTGSPASPDSLDVQISSYATSLGGSVNVWINNSLAFAVSGVTLATDSNTVINGYRFSGAGPSANSIAGKFAVSVSEVIIADTDTRNLSLATLTPAANGNTTNWDTGTVTNVNETTLDDATLNASGSAGQIQQYTIGALPAGSYGIAALGIGARSQAGTAGGPTKMDLGYRTNSTNFWGSDLTLSGSLGRSASIFYTNSDTGNAFLTGDIGAVGFNIGMKSVA